MTDEALLKVYANYNAADGVRFDMHYREQMLRAHVAALRAVYERGREDGGIDGKRYRWLRNTAGAEMSQPDLPPMIYMQGKPGTYAEPVGTELDAAIDVAMQRAAPLASEDEGKSTKE